MIERFANAAGAVREQDAGAVIVQHECQIRCEPPALHEHSFAQIAERVDAPTRIGLQDLANLIFAGQNGHRRFQRTIPYTFGTMAALNSGVRLGPYEILDAIGAGGMGEVYRGRDTRLDRIVAIKILAAGLATDVTSRERFDREAKAISSLNHPNICVLHDVGRERPQGSEGPAVDFLVMEFLEGETLAARLARTPSRPMSVQEALSIAIPIAAALDRAHRQGIVHRDLKPGNVMLTKSGIKLLDFGLARLTSATSGSDSKDGVGHGMVSLADLDRKSTRLN